MAKRITNIVFTKNRPLQLHGFLESLRRYFPPDMTQTVVLYKEDLFDEQYASLFAEFADCIVVRETNYYRDLMRLIDTIETDYIMFGVDDVVYFDGVDMAEVDAALLDETRGAIGFSLRMYREGLISKGQPVEKVQFDGHDLWSVQWPIGKTPDAKYPFDLSATIYTTRMMRKLHRESRPIASRLEGLFTGNAKRLRKTGQTKFGQSLLKRARYFYDPNTHEAWVHRWCRRHAAALPSRLVFQNPCACALQLNRVNLSIENDVVGDESHSIHHFNECYKRGERIDIDHVAAHPPEVWEPGPEYCVLRQR